MNGYTEIARVERRGDVEPVVVETGDSRVFLMVDRVYDIDVISFEPEELDDLIRALLMAKERIQNG